MNRLSALMALLLLWVSACGQANAPASGPSSEAPRGELQGADDSTGRSESLSEDTERHDALERLPEDRGGELPTSERERRVETDVGPDAEGSQPLDAYCDIELSDEGEVVGHIEANFKGYEENVFGAAIYGHMLKIWISDGSNALELLIRMNQSTIPGDIVPGVPGEAAWLIMILDGSQVYSTQPPSGQVTLLSCPSDEGVLLSGSIDEVVLFDMGSMMPIRVSGSFEVVLGEVVGEPICSGL